MTPTSTPRGTSAWTSWRISGPPCVCQDHPAIHPESARRTQHSQPFEHTCY
ncbi:unnamed protein product [Gulo gulo]|uniref:Uncharacterized protein n=1 Tax=Gulo gulo TaxID=48420 RepID=A0A9X9Q5V0_GULGU|nr:unnamed protein product [Gulo gulo]